MSEAEKHIEEAQHLMGMMTSPGWLIVEDEAKSRIAGLTKKLVWEDEDKKKSELQANIRSLEFLLTFPRQMVEAAQKATEQAAPRKDGEDAPQ